MPELDRVGVGVAHEQRDAGIEALRPLGCLLDDENRTVPFKRTWTLEGGLRSRFARGLFGSVRLHYGSISDVLYGARFYPSFEVEYRR